MIQDAARVTLFGGDWAYAIDLETGKEVLSFEGVKPKKRKIVARTIAQRPDVVGLLLSTGVRFCGSQDQKVAVVNSKNVHFTPLSEIETGTILRGEAQGAAVNVKVLGVLHYPKREARLVDIVLEHDKPYVAEGILCR